MRDCGTNKIDHVLRTVSMFESVLECIYKSGDFGISLTINMSKFTKLG